MYASEDIQPMTVTLTFSYEADVFEGENDMYALAKEEGEYLSREIKKSIEELTPVQGFKLTVQPDLTH